MASKIEYRVHALPGLPAVLECLECGMVMFDRALHELSYHVSRVKASDGR